MPSSHAILGNAESDDVAFGNGAHRWAELFPSEGRGFEMPQSENDLESDQLGS